MYARLCTFGFMYIWVERMLYIALVSGIGFSQCIVDFENY